MNRKFRGKIIGGNEIDARLGSGAASRVFGAGNLAIKVFHATKDTHEDFETECHILYLLGQRGRHDNVIQAMQYGSHLEMCNGWPRIHPYILYERFETSLTKYMRRNPGGLPASLAVSVARQIVSGLSFIHACGILHADIKPSNIFVRTSDWRVVIGDFSASGIVGEINKLCVGTVPYLPPEVILEYGELYTQSSDVWPLVLTIFYVFTGETFFDVYGRFGYDYGQLEVNNYMDVDFDEEELPEDDEEIPDLVEEMEPDTESSGSEELDELSGESEEERMELNLILAIAYVMLGAPPKKYKKSPLFSRFYTQNKMNVIGHPSNMAKTKPVSEIVFERLISGSNNCGRHLIHDPIAFKGWSSKLAEIMAGGIKYMPAKRIELTDIVRKLTELQV